MPLPWAPGWAGHRKDGDRNVPCPAEDLCPPQSGSLKFHRHRSSLVLNTPCPPGVLPCKASVLPENECVLGDPPDWVG